MPIEIKELVVRTIIEQPSEPSFDLFRRTEKKEEERIALVKECVANVLKVLKNQAER